jgi:hypothetical protein
MEVIMKHVFILTAILFYTLFSMAVDDIINMPVNTWLEVPNTHLRDVTPKSGEFSGIWGVEGPSAVIDDWNGAAYDTKRHRLICTGGGHSGYYGNEVYAFDVPTLKWSRLNDPTENPSRNSDIQWDGTPRDRHTYNTPTYISHTDEMFLKGGPLMLGSSWLSEPHTWTFNFGNLEWTNNGNAGTPPYAWSGSWAMYDPATKKIWYGEGFNSNPSSRWGLYSFDLENKQWERSLAGYVGGRTPCLDTKRGLIITTGNPVPVFTVRAGTVVKQTWTTQNHPGFSRHEGLDYDPVADRFVAWSGGAVHILNPETKVWTSRNPGGSPTPNGTGTYRRFCYVPLVNAFISVNDVDKNVFFYKHTAGAGTTLMGRDVKGHDMELQVYPNPIKSVSKIAVSYQLSAVSKINLELFNINGKLIKTLIADSRQLKAGIRLNTSGLPTGIYILKAQVANKTVSKRLLIQK